MEKNPYSPPSAPVEDRIPRTYANWGRAIWLFLPVFAILVLLIATGWDELAPEITAVNVAAGLALSSLLLYHPLRLLVAQSEEASPWYWDVLYYLSIAVFFGAIILEFPWLMVAAGLPTVVLNGVLGIASWVLERKRPVKVYVSARRFLFSPNTDAG